MLLLILTHMSHMYDKYILEQFLMMFCEGFYRGMQRYFFFLKYFY